MSLLCACPPAAALPDISTSDCFENIGQVQKLLFQRTKSGTTVNTITISSTDPDTLATWTALKAAVDSTKVVATPFVQNPEFEPGEPRLFGGGNQTLGGVELTIGREGTVFTASFYRIVQKIITELKQLECEPLSVFLIDESGKIWGLTDDHDTPTTFKGIPLTGTLFIGDKQPGGFEGIDQNSLRFALEPGWSDYLYAVTPSDFNAKQDL